MSVQPKGRAGVVSPLTILYSPYPAALNVLICYLVVLPVLLSAQANLFTGASFEHEVTPRWGYEFEVEHRQQVKSGRDNRVLLLAAVNRLLSSGLDLTTGARLTPYYGVDPTVLRLFSDLNYRYPLVTDRLALEARLRSQYERNFTEAGRRNEVAVRPRLGLAVRAAAHTEMVLEAELRYRFDVYDRIVQQRFTLGVEQLLSTRIRLDTFARMERDPGDSGSGTQPFFGVYLLYVLPDRRDRDWEYRSPFGRSLLW